MVTLFLESNLQMLVSLEFNRYVWSFKSSN